MRERGRRVTEIQVEQHGEIALGVRIGRVGGDCALVARAGIREPTLAATGDAESVQCSGVGRVDDQCGLERPARVFVAASLE